MAVVWSYCSGPETSAEETNHRIPKPEASVNKWWLGGFRTKHCAEEPIQCWEMADHQARSFQAARFNLLIWPGCTPNEKQLTEKCTTRGMTEVVCTKWPTNESKER